MSGYSTRLGRSYSLLAVGYIFVLVFDLSINQSNLQVAQPAVWWVVISLWVLAAWLAIEIPAYVHSLIVLRRLSPIQRILTGNLGFATSANFVLLRWCSVIDVSHTTRITKRINIGNLYTPLTKVSSSVYALSSSTRKCWHRGDITAEVVSTSTRSSAGISCKELHLFPLVR